MASIGVIVAESFLIIVPVATAAILNHVITLYFNLWPWAAIPISEKLFGHNKTWRAFLSFTIWCTFGSFIALALDLYWLHYGIFNENNFLVIGLTQGVGWVLGELPNSFLKRRANIGSGEIGTGVLSRFFIVLNQFDSPLACSLLGYLFSHGITASHFPFTVLIGGSLHFLGNLVLYKFNIRKAPPY